MAALEPRSWNSDWKLAKPFVPLLAQSKYDQQCRDLVGYSYLVVAARRNFAVFASVGAVVVGLG